MREDSSNRGQKDSLDKSSSSSEAPQQDTPSKSRDETAAAEDDASGESQPKDPLPSDPQGIRSISEDHVSADFRDVAASSPILAGSDNGLEGLDGEYSSDSDMSEPPEALLISVRWQ